MDECADAGSGACRGEITLHASSIGTMIPRCDRHFHDRLLREEELRHIYPDSPIAPSWFDETLAGERWDDDY